MVKKAPAKGFLGQQRDPFTALATKQLNDMPQRTYLKISRGDGSRQAVAAKQDTTGATKAKAGTALKLEVMRIPTVIESKAAILP